jgi:prepilin-type N-terminal cleavage/methylation domain-containing protein
MTAHQGVAQEAGMRTLRIERGFSLVELLVVIAVVALLAAIILPSLTRAREYARNIVCINNLRQIGIGCLVFATDNKGVLPYNDTDSHPGLVSNGGWWKRIGWHEVGDHSDRSRGFLNDVWRDDVNWGDWDPYIGTFPSNPKQHWYLDPAKGKYLPPEIMWCPVVVARNWKLHDYYMGTWKARRKEFFRWQRLGYCGYMGSVGCPDPVKYPKHVGLDIDGVQEEPYRPATKNKHVRHSSPPEVWLMSCKVGPSGPSVGRGESGHFFTQLGLGYRLNVLHLDGHVFTHTWLSPYSGNVVISSWGRSRKKYVVYGGIGPEYNPAYGLDRNR